MNIFYKRSTIPAPNNFILYEIRASTAGDLLSKQKYFDNYTRYIWRSQNKLEYDNRFELYDVKKPSNDLYGVLKKYILKNQIYDVTIDNIDTQCDKILKDIKCNEANLDDYMLTKLPGIIKTECMKYIGKINERHDLYEIAKIYNLKNLKITKTLFEKSYEIQNFQNQTKILIFKGQIDARTDDTVIDSKRSGKPLPIECPFKAKIQLYIYMYLLDLKKAVLVMWYKDEHRLYNVFWNDETAKFYFFHIFRMRDRITDILNSYYAKRDLLTNLDY